MGSVYHRYPLRAVSEEPDRLSDSFSLVAG